MKPEKRKLPKKEYVANKLRNRKVDEDGIILPVKEKGKKVKKQPTNG